MKVLVHVILKPDVLDPQGKAIAHACGSLGLSSVEGVRQGKLFELDVAARDPEEGRSIAEQVAEKLLANPVIEDYEIVGVEG